MEFKVNIGTKQGKTYNLKTSSKVFLGKAIRDTVLGKDISSDLEGYEFEITGASDSSGFPALEFVEGVGLKRVLLSYGKGMKKHPRKEGKKKRSNPKPKGLRLRKTIRGRVISDAISEINLKIIKQGKKPLEEIFKKPEEKPKT